MILQNEHFWKFSEENRKNGRLSNEEIDTYSFPRKLHGGECCAKRAFVGEKIMVGENSNLQETVDRAL